MLRSFTIDYSMLLCSGRFTKVEMVPLRYIGQGIYHLLMKINVGKEKMFPLVFGWERIGAGLLDQPPRKMYQREGWLP